MVGVGMEIMEGLFFVLFCYEMEMGNAGVGKLKTTSCSSYIGIIMWIRLLISLVHYSMADSDKDQVFQRMV